MSGRLRRAVEKAQVRANEHYTFTPDQGWPRAIPIGAAVIVGINLLAAVHQRQMLWGPGPHGAMGAPWHNGYSMGWTIAAAALAYVPYLMDAIGVIVQRPVGLPLALFPIPVGIGIGYLVFHPTATDFAPFVFVFTAAEVVSRVRGGDSLHRQSRRPGVEGLSSFYRLPLGGLEAWGAVVGIGVMIAAEAAGRFEGAFIWVIGISFGYFGGFMVGELDRRKHELELAQASLAEKAASDERARIAREVHDVIAHSLSVTMLHVSAARMSLERGREAEALEALEEAEKQGRSSLGEVRRTVGLLGPDESGTAAPMPGVPDLPRLASDFRAAGLDVHMDINADPEHIPPAAGLNVYRIVQEALTNAVKHAPGAPVSVDVRMNKENVYVRVHNPRVNGASPNTSGSGMGLQSMAERAALLGASLSTDADDGWTVTVKTPHPT
jgi:signal transduction histidine kinase